MVTKYKLVFWVFNMGAWSQAMREASDTHGQEFVAQMLEVSPKTMSNWISGNNSAYREFPHPSMSNFVKACNQLDLDPRGFFMLSE